MDEPLIDNQDSYDLDVSQGVHNNTNNYSTDQSSNQHNQRG